jgi:hypothetical protein
MPDNLSISISADTSKARADLELLNAKVRDLRKEVRAASAEAQASGGMTPRLEAATAAITQAEAQQRAYARAARATTEANVEASASFAGLEKNIAGFARAAGLGIASSRALRFGLLAMVGAEVIRGFSQLVDKITELSDTSKKTGFSTSTIQALESALTQTGGKAEDAKGILEKLASTVKLTFDIYGKAVMSAGDGTDELSKALRALNIDTSKFKLGTQAGLDQYLTAVAQALVKLKQAGRIDEANLLSTEILGKNYREIGAMLERIVQGGGLEALKQSLEASGQLVKPEDVERTKQMNEAIAGLKNAWTGLLLTLSETGAFDAITEILKQISELIKTEIGPYVKATADEIYGLAKAIGAVADAMGLVPHDFGGGGSLPDARQFASGGYVRGPGSGTSDSIMARLSNGEFVMRAAAVDRWGPQFMAALNNMRNPFAGFAQGGLVRGLPAFAAGGMVSATTSDGTPVNLIFPGGTFALRGDNATVGALTREARRAGMLAAGRRAGLLQ